MINMENNYFRINFLKKEIKSEFESFFRDYFSDDNNYKHTEERVVFSNNINLLEEPTKTLDHLSLERLLVNYHYFLDNIPSDVNFNKSIVTQCLYLKSLLKKQKLRIVIPSKNKDKLMLFSTLYEQLLFYNCDICFDENNPGFIWKNDKENSYAVGVHFEVEKDKKYIFCGYNALIYQNDKPVANNFVSNVNNIVYANISSNDYIVSSETNYNELLQFCDNNSNRQKIIDAIGGIINLLSRTEKISEEELFILYRYSKVVASLCIIEDIPKDMIKTIINLVGKSLKIAKKSIIADAYLKINKQMEVVENFSEENPSLKEMLINNFDHSEKISNIFMFYKNFLEFSKVDAEAIKHLNSNNTR